LEKKTVQKRDGRRAAAEKTERLTAVIRKKQKRAEPGLFKMKRRRLWGRLFFFGALRERRVKEHWRFGAATYLYIKIQKKPRRSHFQAF